MYPLDTHISNHCQAFEDIRELSKHITVPVPDHSQIFKYLIDILTCGYNTLQVAIGLVWSNTNEMRQNFEASATALIEVDPYRQSQRAPGPFGANVLTA